MSNYSGLSPDVQALMEGIANSKADITPIATAIRQARLEEEAARRAKEAETFRTAKPGQEIKGHGIFVGIYEPTDRDGRSLGLVFNVVAAPEDLDGAHSYNDTVNIVANLKDWHGHDGGAYRNQDDFIAALKDGTYKGGWVIPPRELLYGRSAGAGQRGGIKTDEDRVQPDNLLEHRHKKAFNGTYESGPYWSSAMMSIGSMVWNIRLSDGHESYDNPRTNTARCRPIRLVEARLAPAEKL